jgi:hypothetical protein
MNFPLRDPARLVPPHAEGKQEICLFTVDRHGIDYFFHAVQAAVLLSKQHGCDVRVVFIPAQERIRKMINRLRDRLRSGPRRPEGQRAGDAPHEPIYRRFATGTAAVLQRGSRRIRFEHARLTPIQRLRSSFRGLRSALRIWLGSFRRLRFQPLRFLRAEHKGIRIGDLAASSFFRSRLSGDDLTPNPYLFYLLWKSCRLIEITELLWRKLPDVSSFTMTSEPCYVSAAPQRFLHRAGATAVRIDQPCAAIDLVPSPASPAGRRPAEQFVRPDVHAHGRDVAEAVEEHFAIRLHDAMKTLWYMSVGQNDNTAASLLDLHSHPVTMSEDAVYAVVFLHSFADAQYFFGLDGFESIAAWTYHTIDRCLRNGNIENVFIKPHPGTDYRTFPSDRGAFQRLLRRYRGESRVQVLHPNASLIQLCRRGRVVGITHHGSVAEELVYLGRPVIASVFAPWRDQYRFARLWATPPEYDVLLDAIAPHSWRPPSVEERAELFRFVADNRVGEVPPEARFPRVMLADAVSRHRDDRPATLGSPAYEAYERCLDDLSEDQPEFTMLLDAFEGVPARVTSDVLDEGTSHA